MSESNITPGEHEVAPEKINLTAEVEAILFVAPGSVTPAQLAAALETSTKKINRALDQLAAEYNRAGSGRGLRLQRHQNHVQLTTAPEATQAIERFLGLETTGRLSQAALETLAIVAYQEPVTRPQIDAIRGVNSDGVLKSLLSKGLIQEVGRAETPGRPILYSTTAEFLQNFGLNSIADLPPLELDAEAAAILNGNNGKLLKD